MIEENGLGDSETSGSATLLIEKFQFILQYINMLFGKRQYLENLCFYIKQQLLLSLYDNYMKKYCFRSWIYMLFWKSYEKEF